MVAFDGKLTAPKMEDGGQAMIVEFDETATSEVGADGCFFLRLMSWDEDKKHVTLSALAGQRVRITVEILDDGAGAVIHRPE